MALTVGNKTNDLNNPGAATTRTFSHTHNAGSDGYLFIVTGHSSAAFSITGITYNSVSMTNIDSRTTTSTGMVIKTWRLASPATGANNVVITFSTGPFNPISTECISFTGSSGEGNIGFTDTGGPPNTTSIGVSQNSVIIGVGIAGTAGTDVTIDGSSRTIDWNNNANNFVFGGTSASLSSGSRTTSVNSSATVAAYAIEVKEVSSSSATSKNTQIVWLD